MPTLAGGNPVTDGVGIAEIDAEVRAVPDRKRCIRRSGRRDSRRRWPRVFSVGAKHEFILERRIEHGLEGTRGQDRTCGRTGHEHAADVRNDAGGGDHQEINGSPNKICEAVVVRSGQEPVVINLDVETPEPASAGRPGMPFHPGG